MDFIETTRDYLSSTMEIYATRATRHINQGIQKRTSISAVILPLTLIAIVYGMNFVNMPELATRYGYFAAIVVIGAIMLYYLHRRRMLWGGSRPPAVRCACSLLCRGQRLYS